MNSQLPPARSRDDAAPWERTLYAFLGEKERRSGSRRTLENYARLLWPFLSRVGSPETVTPAHVLAWAYGVVGHRWRWDRGRVLLLPLRRPDERPRRQPVRRRGATADRLDGEADRPWPEGAVLLGI